MPDTATTQRATEVVRSPSDVLRLVVGVIALAALLLVEALFGNAVIGFASDLLRGFDAIDETVLTAVVVAVRVGVVCLLLAEVVSALGAGRGRFAATAAVAMLAGAGLFWVVDHWIDAQREALAHLSDSVGVLSSDRFPSTVVLAMVAAVMTAAGPWSARNDRRIGWEIGRAHV